MLDCGLAGRDTPHEEQGKHLLGTQRTSNRLALGPDPNGTSADKHMTAHFLTVGAPVLAASRLGAVR